MFDFHKVAEVSSPEVADAVLKCLVKRGNRQGKMLRKPPNSVTPAGVVWRSMAQTATVYRMRYVIFNDEFAEYPHMFINLWLPKPLAKLHDEVERELTPIIMRYFRQRTIHNGSCYEFRDNDQDYIYSPHNRYQKELTL